MSAERDRVAGFGRLEDGFRQGGDWFRWGPYLSERHGLAGFSDIEQRLCLSLALWNGRDPVLKERAFGLTGAEGNLWRYLDAIPSHAWTRWRYHYRRAPFPYQDLTGRYWIIEVRYAKAAPDDLLMAISVANAGPGTETLHVLPTCWFRNTWSRGAGASRPAMAAGGASVRIEHPFLGPLELIADSGPDRAAPAVLFCENETNTRRASGAGPITPYPDDGINDYVIHGATTVNPRRTGTKCAFWYEVTVPPGDAAELRLRLRPAAEEAAPGTPAPVFGYRFDEVMAARRAEADEFYAELTPREASADEAMVMRQAFAGMLISLCREWFEGTEWS